MQHAYYNINKDFIVNLVLKIVVCMGLKISDFLQQIKLTRFKKGDNNTKEQQQKKLTLKY